MLYSEAEKQIKALSSKYEFDMKDGDFNIVHNGKNYDIYVSGDSQYHLGAGNTRCFSELPFCNKLYMILAELASTPLDEREEEKKYYVKIFDGKAGYLNINIIDGGITTNSMYEDDAFKTKFTNKAIEQLKQRDDIPLDWNKVRFEEAN